MSKTHGTDTAWRARVGDARATIKLMRQQLQAVIERSTVQHVIPRDLPDSLRRLLRVYRQRHPEFELEPICYLAFDAADDNRPALEQKNLPDEEQLVVLTCTESAADISDVYVKTQTLPVRRRRKE
jgi:hypothetical protein